MPSPPTTAEHQRLAHDARREANWKRWGPYLSERQWGTVREDYSPNGDAWGYFPHDHARSRAYRWGEDGLLGWCDRECRLCFAIALWNGRDPILKERLFGLTHPQGNHGEDVKERYYYLDATPTYSYAKATYHYPQTAYPYEDLVRINAERGRDVPEYELEDTGVFDGGKYFDVQAEYAKASDNDTLIRLIITNRRESVDGDAGLPDASSKTPQRRREESDVFDELHLLPALWFRNTWVWGCEHEGCWGHPQLERRGDEVVHVQHEDLKDFEWIVGAGPGGEAPDLLFTQNETNEERLYGAENEQPYVKDAIHRRVVDGDAGATDPGMRGTKAAAWYRLRLRPGESATVKLRLRRTGGNAVSGTPDPIGSEFDQVFEQRRAEADAFYTHVLPTQASEQERVVARQAYAGLLWSKQFYHYVVEQWLEGDPAMPTPPPQRWHGRNADWLHLFNRDVISMPDAWEYPWYAAWDLAFHMVPMAEIDPAFAKHQLSLFLREWYLAPNGQLPAYEFGFSDTNPPVHAWACWRVYKIADEPSDRDRQFLASAFQKLLLNFTWWVNREDPEGNNVFGGGFLGLDNIGVFDRSSRSLPDGSELRQSDATAWMAFYCHTMLAIALDLAQEEPEYADMASKFFEHFVHIADAMNSLGGNGLWDDEDGFYYDQLRHEDGRVEPLKVRSLVGLIPLIAVEVLDGRQIDALPGFRKRMRWFLKYRSDLARHITWMECDDPRGDDCKPGEGRRYLLAIPSRERLERVLRCLFDENEFLSPFGIRSLSKYHEANPFTIELDGKRHSVGYEPGESRTEIYGGNSNWRGPIWFPVNYLLIEALQRYDRFYGNELKVELPTGSGRWVTLGEAASEVERRLASLFVPDESGRRPCMAGAAEGEAVLFHEYFDAETGRGLGASHQTGWTSLIARCLKDIAARRA